MMAVGHSLSGWCAGLAVGAAVSAPAPLVLASAFALAGAAVLNDIDHQGSTITTSLGAATGLVHRGVVALHQITVRALRRTGDRGDPPGAHRGITHWWPCPPVVAGLVTVGCAASRWVVFGVLMFLFLLALRALSVPEYRDNGRRGQRSRKLAHRWAEWVPTIRVLRRLRRWSNRVGKVGMLIVAAFLAAFVLSIPETAPYVPWLGLLVGAGMVLHIAGDAPTESGIPGWRLWTEWRLPKWLAFKAGGAFEVGVLWVSMSIFGVLLLPGVLPLLIG